MALPMYQAVLPNFDLGYRAVAQTYHTERRVARLVAENLHQVSIIEHGDTRRRRTQLQHVAAIGPAGQSLQIFRRRMGRRRRGQNRNRLNVRYRCSSCHGRRRRHDRCPADRRRRRRHQRVILDHPTRTYLQNRPLSCPLCRSLDRPLGRLLNRRGGSVSGLGGFLSGGVYVLENVRDTVADLLSSHSAHRTTCDGGSCFRKSLRPGRSSQHQDNQDTPHTLSSGLILTRQRQYYQKAFPLVFNRETLTPLDSGAYRSIL